MDEVVKLINSIYASKLMDKKEVLSETKVIKHRKSQLQTDLLVRHCQWTLSISTKVSQEAS